MGSNSSKVDDGPRVTYSISPGLQHQLLHGSTSSHTNHHNARNSRNDAAHHEQDAQGSAEDKNDGAALKTLSDDMMRRGIVGPAQFLAESIKEYEKKRMEEADYEGIKRAGRYEARPHMCGTERNVRFHPLSFAALPLNPRGI